MPTTKVTANEIAERGEAIYEQHIHAKFETEHVGKFLAIDIVTGDYEMDEDDYEASDRLWARYPGNLQYDIRIGYKAAGVIGATWAAAKLK
ncbi:MAG: hypothetical protein H7145_24380 [Akkermansiaceae bacterium]|nr:hypothetical protein [Armatimonadota bacterium]